MRSTHRLWTILLLTGLSSTALTGCGTQFVEDAARDSLSSFVIGVLSTAVTETVNPSD
jgi:hypothetical protein